MAKEKQTPRGKATEALMSLVAELGWEKSTLNLVADRAGISLADLAADIQNRFDLLDHFGQQTNQRALKIAEEEGGSEAVRDKLFALLMARFDVLAEHKAAIISLSKSARRDPGLALYFAQKIRSTMSLFLEASGVNTSTLQGRVRASGLAMLYGKVIRVWFKDDSEDLAKTMKALDAALADAERWGKRLNGNWKDVDMKFWKRRPRADDAVQAA
jgi:AcrR family transcriptional regulator